MIRDDSLHSDTHISFKQSQRDGYSFFRHLLKCCIVMVELLCCIRNAVCSVGELIVLT
jgi:hypothetical protein